MANTRPLIIASVQLTPTKTRNTKQAISIQFYGHLMGFPTNLCSWNFTAQELYIIHYKIACVAEGFVHVISRCVVEVGVRYQPIVVPP